MAENISADDLINSIEAGYIHGGDLRKQINRLEAARPTGNSSTFKPSFGSSLENDEPVKHEEISRFETFVNQIISSYKDLDGLALTLEELSCILPPKENAYFELTIKRLIFESENEINEWKRANDLKTLSKEDKEFYYCYIDSEKRKISLLKQLLEYEEESNIDEEENNSIILVPSGCGNIKVIEDLKNISQEYYDKFATLINSIINGNFKGAKTLRMTENKSSFNICEVRLFGDGVRVFYTRLSEKCYAILGVFVKKCLSDSYYQSYLSNILDICKSQLPAIAEKIDQDDQEFIAENEDRVQDLFSLLGYEDRVDCEGCEAMVLKRGGIYG